ncbi:hypothetical protein, partial [Streptomyces anulatus]|uniref:hypothetical protein n=1 Tax=Streptomyces anulatus TaxID=1892 RepID=UPI00341D4DF7
NDKQVSTYTVSVNLCAAFSVPQPELPRQLLTVAITHRLVPVAAGRASAYADSVVNRMTAQAATTGILPSLTCCALPNVVRPMGTRPVFGA